jgi:phosphatidylethanolamine/phosphatidyl-N-methylethanolamine N-methyltransferase
MSGQEFRESHTSDDLGHFVKGWIRNPLAMGAFAPSGKSLAKLMARDVGPGSRVLELGAGTGTVTEALLANGVAPEDLYVVERERPFVRILERRFPQCHVIAADALDLNGEVTSASFDFVVSGLPLLLFSTEQRHRVLQQALRLLKPQGHFHQFTYGGVCPLDKDLRATFRMDSVLLGIAPLNLPPGFVYRLTRRPSAAAPENGSAAVHRSR